MAEVAKVRVIFGDTDAMGMVYHATYLRYFEIGRAEWLRSRGRAYREVQEEGVWLPVVEVAAKYRAPARYDDLLSIDAVLTEVRSASATFTYRLLRDDAVLVEGHSVHACIDQQGKPRRFPDNLVQLLQPG